MLLSVLIIGTPRDSIALEKKAYCTPEEQKKYIPVRKRLQDVGVMLTLYSCDTSHPSHILGTLHSDNHKIISKSKKAFAILSQSKAAFFEIISDKKTNLEIISRVLLPQNETNTLQSLLGDALFKQAKALILQYHEGFPDPILLRYRPWASTILMEYPAPKGDGAVLDELLQVHARKSNVPLQSLETVAEQFATFEDMTRGQEVNLVRDTITNITAIRNLNDELERAYIAGNMAEVERIGKLSFFEVEDKNLRNTLLNGIIYRRNQSMAERIIPELRLGNRFIGIGVLHLVGENGVLERLEKAGFYIF